MKKITENEKREKKRKKNLNNRHNKMLNKGILTINFRKKYTHLSGVDLKKKYNWFVT